MSDERYILVWADGREESMWAELRTRDGCLIITEHFGVTGGVKQMRTIPLAQLREWRMDR
jgi:hypothetical protein